MSRTAALAVTREAGLVIPLNRRLADLTVRTRGLMRVGVWSSRKGRIRNIPVISKRTA